MRIVDRILHLAEQRDISANKLAVECKLNNSAITRWRQNKMNPSIDALIKIANYFNVTVDYLIGRNSDIQLIQNEIDTLTPPQRIAVTAFIKTMKAEENRVKKAQGNA